ncbi:polysaccharide deacetylase family protein [Tissierella creatinophila]|uniref:Peptidoglycan-N-acetylglucosamine deacetylase n=1 Tax=Tissierella creatinophila DSM 6911 TaxID=1123403 RepID=A0A1U7M585_TISCR|nr:polysaccharide deacetylase family protein [Tissierella creatinophila]OLS02379.1 peptidoglycan-N-acetylglucosamine deacetylase [Tissierella creatinophila DSM 6911]
MKTKFKISLFLLTLFLILGAVSDLTYAQELPNVNLTYLQRGQAVKDLQSALNKIGYKLDVDGVYGPNTRSAILDFQRKYPSLVDDGKYGPKTRAVLMKVLKNGPVDEIPIKGKIAYLTFDDGPSKTITPKILQILDKYDIKATFFILGNMAEQNPAILKTINSKGHSIGHHSYSHKYKYIYSNMDNFWGEINRTEKILKKQLGNNFHTHLLRLPGGSFEAYKKPYKKSAIDKGYRVYDWNALNGDSEAKNVSVNRQMARIKETVKGQSELIVLMHDSNGKENTIKALPQIIEYLKSKGYSFKALSQ